MRIPLRPLLLLAALLAGCPTDPATDDDVTGDGDGDGICPTRIDVFGYSNVAFTFCGGFDYPSGASDAALAEGKFAPGVHEYDMTLAGRLQELVEADAELTARFGTDWQIRSCSTGGGTMDTFVEHAVDEPGECTPMGNFGGSFSAMCTEDPAPVQLFVANNVNDWCHGGGPDAPEGFQQDDEEAYQAHWVELLEAFVRERAPETLLVSPMHEWHGEQLGGLDDPATCGWRRPDWNASAPLRWVSDPPADLPVEPIFLETMQATFRAHHPCCEVFEDIECLENWFGEPDVPDPGTGDGWVHFGCHGANALADFWFDQLKTTLLDDTGFSCGGDGSATR